MKKWNLIILMLLMLPLAAALIDCKEIVTPNDIPCVVRSTWDYSNCSTTEVKIYNSTPSLISTRNFTDYGDSGRCNITWNITEKGSYFWNISNGDTGKIIIQNKEDEMASLAVTLFVMIITIGVFYIAFKVEFTNSKWSNHMIKRVIIIFGLFLMSLNTVIVVTLSDVAGLGVNKELFRYLWMLNWSIYVSMIILFFTGVVGALKLWKIEKVEKRGSG